MPAQMVRFSTGYVPYGHLYGEHALSVEFADDGTPMEIPQIVEQVKATEEQRILLSPFRTVPLRFLDDLSGALAKEGLECGGLIRVTVCRFPPMLAVRSILVVETAEQADAAQEGDLDTRVASVSLQGWYGSLLCRRLTTDLAGPLGRYIVASGEAYRTAQEWVASPDCTEKWTVRPELDEE